MSRKVKETEDAKKVRDLERKEARKNKQNIRVPMDENELLYGFRDKQYFV